MQEFHPAKKRVEVSADESVRILRALLELSQSRLFELTGIHQATTSAIENNRVNLGGWRTKVFARALKCHTAVLVFSGWKVPLKAEETTSHPTRQPKDGCQVVGYAA